MSPPARDQRDPYSTWLFVLLSGLGLAWLAVAAVWSYEYTHPGPLDDVVVGPEPMLIADAIVAVLAALPIGAAVRIRWSRATPPGSTWLLKAALVSILIGAVLGGLGSYVELTHPWRVPDWRVVVSSLAVVVAALSAVVLMSLRARYFRSVPPNEG